jgi:hypothetical protein
MLQGITFISGTHTYTCIATSYSFYTSVTHPTVSTQDIWTCHPFWTSANCSSTQGDLLFLLHSSILSKHNECSPEVLLCMRKILLQVQVEISQDVTVKPAHRSAQLYTNYAMLQSPIMSCNMRTVIAKPRNVPSIVTSPTNDGPSSHQSKYCHYTGSFLPPAVA